MTFLCRLYLLLGRLIGLAEYGELRVALYRARRLDRLAQEAAQQHTRAIEYGQGLKMFGLDHVLDSMGVAMRLRGRCPLCLAVLGGEYRQRLKAEHEATMEQLIQIAEAADAKRKRAEAAEAAERAALAAPTIQEAIAEKRERAALAAEPALAALSADLAATQTEIDRARMEIHLQAGLQP